MTKIFHPNVANNGDICVNTLKKDWTPEVTLTHVLQVIRCLLIVPFPESSLNDEAGKMFMESYDEYAARARIVTEVHALPNTKASAEPEEAMPSSENAQKKKEKDAKKKSLKRL
jgi:ubiquitin-conjugating enzyme E2 S